MEFKLRFHTVNGILLWEQTFFAADTDKAREMAEEMWCHPGCTAAFFAVLWDADCEKCFGEWF